MRSCLIAPAASVCRIAGVSVLGLVAGLALSACGAGASSSSSSAPSVATQPASALPATTQPATTQPAASAAGTSASAVPVQTFPDGAFYSPSGNIGCNLDYPLNGQTVMSCRVISPELSVQMGVTGKYKILCAGQKCGPVSPQPAPTLAYGRATVAGPFRCTSTVAGVTCLADGKGFQISRSGVTPVSA